MEGVNLGRLVLQRLLDGGDRALRDGRAGHHALPKDLIEARWNKHCQRRPVPLLWRARLAAAVTRASRPSLPPAQPAPWLAEGLDLEDASNGPDECAGYPSSWASTRLWWTRPASALEGRQLPTDALNARTDDVCAETHAFVVYFGDATYEWREREDCVDYDCDAADGLRRQPRVAGL